MRKRQVKGLSILLYRWGGEQCYQENAYSQRWIIRNRTEFLGEST